MIDENTAALRDHEAHQDYVEEVHERWGKQARYEVYCALMREDIDTVLDILFDDVPACIGDDYDLFKTACSYGRQREIGEIMNRALDEAARRYLDSEHGQNDIAVRVWELERD